MGQPDSKTLPPETQQAGTRLGELVSEARQRVEAGDVEGGIAAFERMAGEFPDVPEVHNNLGAVYAAVGRSGDAEAAFGQVLDLTPNAGNAAYNRGLMRFQRGNYLGARDDFQLASSLNPEDPEIHNNLGTTCFQLQDWPAARAAFETAVELAGDYPAAQLNLVDLDLAEGQLVQAEERCRALADQVDTPEVWLKLADCSWVLATRALETAAISWETAGAHGVEDALVKPQLARLLEARAALRDSGDEANTEAAD